MAAGRTGRSASGCGSWVESSPTAATIEAGNGFAAHPAVAGTPVYPSVLVLSSDSRSGAQRVAFPESDVVRNSGGQLQERHRGVDSAAIHGRSLARGRSGADRW